MSLPGTSYSYDTTIRVVSLSGNSVTVAVTTTAPSFGSNAQTQTILLDQPFPNTGTQFGLALPFYCPPQNLNSCSNQVGLGWQTAFSGIPGVVSFGAPTSSISDSNTQTTAGPIKTSTISVSESYSITSIQVQGSESGSYDSVLGLLASGSSNLSYNIQAQGQSGNLKWDTSTKMADTNIDSWTAGTNSPGGISVPWFLWGIIAAAAVAALVAVLALARRRGRGMAQPITSTVPPTTAVPMQAMQAKPVFCGHCGAQMDSGTAFCGKCGASLA